MKKIAIVMSQLSIGGMERAFIDFVNNFDFSKYIVHVYLGKSGFEWEKQINSKVKINIINKRNIFYKIRIFRKILRELRTLKWITEKYDFSICYSSFEPYLSTITRRLCKNNAVWIHVDFKSFCKKQEFEILSKKMNYNKFLYSICVSNKAKDSYMKLSHINTQKIIVIKNIINGEKILNLSKVKLDDIVFDNKNIKFIHVGRHEEKTKEISKIILALNLLAKKHKNFTMIFVGDGPDHLNYVNLVKKYKLDDKVKFTGFSQNPYKYVKNCDCLVLSSNNEGQCLVLYETAILNRYIITTNVADAKLDIDKKFGIVINRDINSIYHEMKKYMENPIKINKSYDFITENAKNMLKLEQMIEKS